MSETQEETQAAPDTTPEAPQPEPDTLTHPEGEPAITEEDAAESDEGDQDAETIEGPGDEPDTEQEQRERTLQLLNLADFEDIPQAAWAEKCGTCNGHGRVKTGSRAEGREVTQCLDCGGAGWHNLHQRAAANGHTEAQPTTTTGPTVF